MTQSNLFDQSDENILPQDGIVNYYGCVFNNQEANQFLSLLLNQIEWKNDEVEIFGKSKPIEILASVCQTIPYEILCRISTRIKRLYTQG